MRVKTTIFYIEIFATCFDERSEYNHTSLRISAINSLPNLLIYIFIYVSRKHLMILNTNMRKIITQILHRKNVIDEPYRFIYDFLKFHLLSTFPNLFTIQ